MTITRILLNEHHLSQILDSVAQSLSLAKIMPLPKSSMSPESLPALWTGAVMMSGEFEGAVIFRCTAAFAHGVARRVFAEEDSSETAAEEVIAEITNILGGNVKGCLGTTQPVHLSMTLVAPSKLLLPAARLVAEFWANIEGEVACVSVYTAAEPRCSPS